MKRLKDVRLRLYMISFLAGFSLLVFELAAARILAPSIGSSTYAWTSVIGVIIAALSVGYFVGGKLADMRRTPVDIAYISLAAALLVVLMMSSYPMVLSWSVEAFNDARVQGLVVSLLLFAPVSVLLGMLQPYLVKHNVRSLEDSGQSVANLSALDAIGGIVGTFAAGFVLFGFLGSRETMLVVAVVLVVISWLIVPKRRFGWRLLGTAAVLLLGVAPPSAHAQSIPIDTPSAHYEIIETTYNRNNRPIRGLMAGPAGVQSAIYIDEQAKKNNHSELVFWYTNQMAEIVAAAPEKQRILVLGGGTFTLPQYLAREYPDSQIDVVEIDPGLADIAREYFEYQDPRNVTLIFEDARTFVNSAEHDYDVILVDAYGDATVPFSLMTEQYGDQIARLSHTDTVVAANMIASQHAACGELLEYYAAPYSRHFAHSAYWQQNTAAPKSNTMAVYSQQKLAELNGQFAVDAMTPLTDNFAPAERIQQACHDYERRSHAAAAPRQ